MGFRAARDPLNDADLMEAARDLGAQLLARGERERGKEERLREWIEAHVSGAGRLLAGGRPGPATVRSTILERYGILRR